MAAELQRLSKSLQEVDVPASKAAARLAFEAALACAATCPGEVGSSIPLCSIAEEEVLVGVKSDHKVTSSNSYLMIRTRFYSPPYDFDQDREALMEDVLLKWSSLFTAVLDTMGRPAALAEASDAIIMCSRLQLLLGSVLQRIVQDAVSTSPAEKTTQMLSGAELGYLQHTLV